MSMVEQHNKELKKLYEKIGDDILNKVDAYNENNPNHKTAFPLFLKSVEEYENSKIKVMIFGQETNSWYGTYGKEASVEHIMDCYEEFLTVVLPNHKGFFCKGVRELANLWKNSTGKEVGYLWNNIVKIGYANKNAGAKGFPSEFYDSIVKPHLNNLILREIEILKPDYIVFFTGTDESYCKVLNDIFGKIETKQLEGFDIKELCEIIFSNEISGIKKSFRTYHPGHLYRNRKGINDKIFHKIAEEITQRKSA